MAAITWWSCHCSSPFPDLLRNLGVAVECLIGFSNVIGPEMLARENGRAELIVLRLSSVAAQSESMTSLRLLPGLNVNASSLDV